MIAFDGAFLTPVSMSSARAVIPGYIIIPGYMPGYIIGCIPGYIIGYIPGCIPGYIIMPGCIPGCIPGCMPGCMPAPPIMFGSIGIIPGYIIMPGCIGIMRGGIIGSVVMFIIMLGCCMPIMSVGIITGCPYGTPIIGCMPPIGCICYMPPMFAICICCICCICCIYCICSALGCTLLIFGGSTFAGVLSGCGCSLGSG